MYAVIQTGGKQYKVAENDIIEIETMPLSKSKDITFHDVLLCVDKKEATVGQPFIKGAKVTAELVGAMQAPKILTYKYKRRKSYHRTIGHRQDLLRVRIKEIALRKD